MNQSKTLRNTLLLVLTSMIWGLAFVSQSIGAEYVGPYTFLVARSWLAVIFLVPVIAVSDRLAIRRSGRSRAPRNKSQRKVLLTGGTLCGILLFAASAFQQVGIPYTTTAKAGFLTAMYVVIVPILLIFLGHRPEPKIWFCVGLGVAGLYFLCMKNGIGFSSGDVLMLICALGFSFQILTINHFAPMVDGIRLSQLQMLVEAVIATVFMLIFEHPTWAQMKPAVPAFLYAGIMSGGVAYTLQIVAQKDLNPAIASLAMCLESVFSAIGGWLILNQILSGRELFGCALLFLAIVLVQIPLPARKHKENKKDKAVPQG